MIGAYVRVSGFTLAEVLITLGIIGVVSALTLPSVITNYQKHVVENQLKSTYSILSQAMKTAFPDNDFGDEVAENNMGNWFLEYLKPNLKVVKYCVNKAGCWNDGTKTMSGSTFAYDSGATGIGLNIITFDLANGVSVIIDGWNGYEGNSYFGVKTNYRFISFWIDVNGQKKPNVIGKDVFVFVFTKERGLLPAGHDMTDQRIATNCSKSGTGAFCIERIIRNGWKIAKDYPW